MAGSNSWYSQGYEGGKVAEEQARIEAGPKLTRFFLKEETEREIIFLDNEPFQIYEHQFTLGDDFKNWCTCLKDIEDDVPCCEKLGMKSRYLAGFYTVIDCTKFETSDGKVYQYELKLLPAKYGTLNLLKRRAESPTGPNQTTGLAGKLFKVYRTTKKSPTVGDDFTYVRDVDLSKVFPVANLGGKKLPELWKAADDAAKLDKLKKIFQIRLDENNKPLPVPVAFNYFEKLKPMAVKDLRLLLKNATVKSFDKNTNSGSGAGAHADEEVPF